MPSNPDDWDSFRLEDVDRFYANVEDQNCKKRLSLFAPDVASEQIEPLNLLRVLPSSFASLPYKRPQDSQQTCHDRRQDHDKTPHWLRSTIGLNRLIHHLNNGSVFGF